MSFPGFAGYPHAYSFVYLDLQYPRGFFEGIPKEIRDVNTDRFCEEIPEESIRKTC